MSDLATTAIAAPPAAALEADGARCATCGAALTGRWCSQCGQEAERGRQTLRRLIFGGLGRVIGVDGGFVHTAVRLTIAPHTVVTDYLAGRTVRYTHPFAYLVIAFATFALVGELMDVTVAGEGESNRGMTALLVPFVAIASRVVFLRGRFNLAEHLILASYLFGHVALLLAGLQALVPVLTVAAMQALLVCAIVAIVAYFTWVYARVFSRHPALAGLGAIAALIGGVLLWATMLMMLVRVAQR